MLEKNEMKGMCEILKILKNVPIEYGDGRYIVFDPSDGSVMGCDGFCLFRFTIHEEKRHLFFTNMKERVYVPLRRFHNLKDLTNIEVSLAYVKKVKNKDGEEELEEKKYVYLTASDGDYVIVDDIMYGDDIKVDFDGVMRSVQKGLFDSRKPVLSYSDAKVRMEKGLKYLNEYGTYEIGDEFIKAIGSSDNGEYEIYCKTPSI